MPKETFVIALFLFYVVISSLGQTYLNLFNGMIDPSKMLDGEITINILAEGS